MAEYNINLGIFAVAAGTADAITATYSPAPASLYNGLVLFFRASGANTSTTPTFKPNTLAAKTVVKKGNQALVAGDIVGDHGVIFNSSLDKWELLNPASDAADTYWQAGAGTDSLMDKRSTGSSAEDGFTAGKSAVNSGAAGQAIGYEANNSESQGQALGNGANNSAPAGQAVGQSAVNSGSNGQALGSNANNSGQNGQAVGAEAVNAFARSTALGYQSVSTADDQMNLAQTLRLQAYAGAGTKILQHDNDGILSGSNVLPSDTTATTQAEGDSSTKPATTAFVANAVAKQPEVIAISCSDLTTNLATGTTKGYIRMPFAMTLTSVKASVIDAPTGSTIIVDINESGSTILSTRITIDASEKTSATAAAPPVISDTALANDAEITVDIDQVGSTNAGKGLIVYLIGTRT